MKQFGKILKFELKRYVKNKAFIGITVFLIVAIAFVTFLPNIISFFSSDGDVADTPADGELPVMLITSSDPDLSELVKYYFDEAFIDYEVKISDTNIEETKKAVENGDAECAFFMKSEYSYTYYVNNLSMYDVNPEIANEVLQSVYRMNAMIQNGLTPEEASEIMSVQIESEIMSVQIESETETFGKNQMDNFLYTYIMIFALYMVILLYGQMVTTNVATEKSSRAMELLVTSAKPTSMMFGKVLASCIAGFSQLVLVFSSAILFYNLNRANLSNPIIASIFDIPVDLFIYMIVFFLLGFLIYAFMYGAIGSTVSKLEDINTAVMPITYVFLIAFIVVIFSMTSGEVDNTAMLVCSYVPFTSPMAMFTRIAMSSVAWYEIAISIGILVASTVGIGVISAKIYRVGVLLYGVPPKFTNIIKTVFKKS